MPDKAGSNVMVKADDLVEDANKSCEELLYELRELRQKIIDLEIGQQLQKPINQHNRKIQVFKNRNAYKMPDLFDISVLENLMKLVAKLTGNLNTIIYDANNSVIFASGRMDICSKFHPMDLRTECRCKISDRTILNHLQEGAYIGYKCLNGLMDYSTPIIIEGRHVGTILMGPILHEAPDEHYFRTQAREFGFNESEYMEALKQVPVISQEKVQDIMESYLYLTQFLVTMGLEKKQKLEAFNNAIRMSEDKFGKAFLCSPDIITISTFKDGYYSEVNEAFINRIGYERYEAIGHKASDLGIWPIPSERDLLVNKIIKNGKINNYEAHMRTRDNMILDVLISADQIEIEQKPYLLCVIKDITEQKAVQNKLMKLDRLNLVGEMAAGIGHEIRNPMTAVRGFLQMFGLKYSEDREFLDLMIEELDRANSIITEFISLAKDKIVELKPVRLNSIIKEILPVLEANARIQDKVIKLDLNHIPYLLLDEKEIRQLILNLVQNGLESMSFPGYVVIKTYREEDKIVLSIKDQGCGIRREVLDKVGIPFFTTKEDGIGLGLAVCYGIVKRHNAWIDIESSSRGTTIYVRFPMMEGTPRVKEKEYEKISKVKVRAAKSQ